MIICPSGLGYGRPFVHSPIEKTIAQTYWSLVNFIYFEGIGVAIMRQIIITLRRGFSFLSLTLLLLFYANLLLSTIPSDEGG